MSDTDKTFPDRPEAGEPTALNQDQRRRLALSLLIDGEYGEGEYGDGEFGDGENGVSTTHAGPSARALDDCCECPELTRAWHGYYLVRSVLRKDYSGAEVNGLVERVRAAIAEERPLEATGIGRPRPGTRTSPESARRPRHMRDRRALGAERGQRSAASGASVTARRWSNSPVRVRTVRHTATAVAAGAVLGVAAWLAVGSSLSGSSDTAVRDTGADGVAVTGAGVSSQQPAAAQTVTVTAAGSPAPERLASARVGPVPRADVRAPVEWTGESAPGSAVEAGDEFAVGPTHLAQASGESFGMTPQHHRRLSSFVVQHAEFQGASVGSPVMPYVVLVGGTTQ
ncbi:MAG: RseA family anti-sigma factor [Gammaproteobacteria bacterium]